MTMTMMTMKGSIIPTKSSTNTGLFHTALHLLGNRQLLLHRRIDSADNASSEPCLDTVVETLVTTTVSSNVATGNPLEMGVSIGKSPN